MPDSVQFQWDAFIAHASEDKIPFVEPLAAELKKYGLNIWFDKFTLRVGSSLRQSIDEGLAKSQFGIVVLSHAFFAKDWPQKELNALFSRQVSGRDVILPVWHGLSKEDLLRYSPLLSDIVAESSSSGIAAVARALAQVIRPQAFEFDAIRQEAQAAATRIRELLKNANPALDSRIIFGPQELDPVKTIGVHVGPGLSISSAQDGMRIEVFAPDPQAYAKAPLSFKLRMTREAVEKLQTAQNEGRLVELGPQEILGVASDFVDPFNPVLSDGFASVQKMIVGPSADTTRRKLRLKLTFTSGEEREEFPYVEFEVIRPGRQELEIHSSSPTLPFELSMILNLAGSPSGISVSYAFVGREVRQVYKALRAIRILSGGGSLELLDLESGERLGQLIGGQLASNWSARDYSLVEDLYEVVTALDETLTLPEAITEDDCIHLQLLREIVRTGRVSVPCDNITLNLVPLQGADLDDVLGGQNLLRVDSDRPPDFATVFGKTLNLGLYHMIIRPGHYEIRIDEPGSNSRIVSIRPAEPVVFQMEKICRDAASGAGPSAL